MATADRSGRDPSARWGYLGAVLISALAHTALGLLLLIVLPEYLRWRPKPPAVYTIKVVDTIPAGNLGLRLPPLVPKSEAPPPKPQIQQLARTEIEPPRLIPPEPENEGKAVTLSTKHVEPTPTPTPPPAPTATPAPELTPAPTASPTPRPQRTPAPVRRSRPRATPRPTPAVAQARAERKPSVKEQLEKLRERLLAEHLKEMKRRHADQESSSEQGPIASVERPGSGMGVGPGSGSEGIQRTQEFLLYYRTVQEKIKEAWSFPAGGPDLTASVLFAIGPDGSVTKVQVTHSSSEAAFDDSVIRAIRRAAPFPPPPEEYRSEFANGVEATFKLSELESSG